MERIMFSLRGENCIRKQWFYIYYVLFISVFLLSCSPPPAYVQKEPVKGIYHRVKKGETFWSIAGAYHIKMQDLAEVNNINNPGLIEEGSVIFIPGANQIIDDVALSIKKMDAESPKATTYDGAVKANSLRENNNGKYVQNAAEGASGAEKKTLPLSAPLEKQKLADMTSREDAPVTASTPPQKPVDEKKIENNSNAKPAEEEKEKIKFNKNKFIWPVQGIVKTRFGIQPNKTYHNWIKIVSAAGTRVKAAAAGTVIFSAPLKDYGETIIIRHENGFATVYTHLKKRFVKIDQKIKKGNVIAVIGEKDEAGDAYLNFEVRWHGKAHNPLLFLPE